MNTKEAKARIKINKLLENAGWIFFNTKNNPANISLETNAKITEKDIDEFGDDYEKTKNGYIDFLLLDPKGFPLVVLEAKKSEKDPLDGKEQARRYAQSQNVRFIILSNGDSHYFWDIETGNPEIITEFPTPESFQHRKSFKPNIKNLHKEKITKEYVAETQYPNFKEDPEYKDLKTKKRFIQKEGIRILRPYQLNAVKSLQEAAKNNKTRYLFEMATGTGKTLVSAAVIKLFLRSGNAKRILFLVDRIELEDQAWKNFNKYLKNDYTTVIYKHNKDDWKKADIVVTTVQSLASQDKFKKLFSPTDFDLIISDEAHRSISGNSRAVFEYFIGYKLGLTATPKDYLKHVNIEKLSQEDPRKWEKRQLLDTYKTFGCESGQPTFRYDLLKAVKEKYLINPIIADARTDITTQLLSDKGYSVIIKDEDNIKEEQTFFHKDFEKKFFNEKTNQVFCQTFIKNALKDPISGEIGKSIVFCVSQKHASKITQILNKIAHQIWPNKYNSDFAVQITSSILNAQQYTNSFANNNLNDNSQFLDNYKTSRTRICVTVGMMTTGYDCQDVLNIVLMRPIFSPTDFIQIKGRGTRKFTFEYKDEHKDIHQKEKVKFKLFDFFANVEYFEDKYDYDEILELPVMQGNNEQTNYTVAVTPDSIELFDPDKIKLLSEKIIGHQGLKIDRKLFEKLEDKISKDKDIKFAVENEQWDKAIDITRKKYENKPKLYSTLDKIKKAENLDRRLTWREVIEKIFGLIPKFKTKEEKLEEECEKFISIEKPESSITPTIKNFIKSYIADKNFRDIIEEKRFADLHFYPGFSMQEYKKLGKYQNIIPEYIKDYVSINQYMD